MKFYLPHDCESEVHLFLFLFFLMNTVNVMAPLTNRYLGPVMSPGVYHACVESRFKCSKAMFWVPKLSKFSVILLLCVSANHNYLFCAL